MLSALPQILSLARVHPLAINVFLQSCGILLLAVALLLVLRRERPALRCLVCRIAFGGVFVCCLWAALTTGRVRPVWKIELRNPPATATTYQPFPAPATATTAAQSPVTAASAPAAATKPANGGAAPAPAAANHAVAPVATEPLITLPRLYLGLIAVWLAVAALLLLWLVVCQARMWLFRRLSSPLKAGPTAALLGELCAEFDIKQPALLTSPYASSPFLIGIWRPAIMLPADYEEQFSPDARRAVLLHELAHLQRNDIVWSMAGRLLCAVLWPQPLLTVLFRSMEQLSEESCDEFVVDGGIPPREYASLLLSLAERLTLKPAERAVGAGVVPFRSALGQRINQVVQYSRSQLRRIPARTRFALVTIIFGTALAAPALIAAGRPYRALATAITYTPLSDLVPDYVADPLPADAPLPGFLEVHDTVPTPSGFRQQTQTINGVTVRIKGIKWLEQSRTGMTLPDAHEKVLEISYDCETRDPALQAAAKTRLGSYVKNVHLLDRWGRQIGGITSNDEDKMYVFNKDPHQEIPALELDFVDPRAPEGALGEFQHQYLIKHLPVPRQEDHPLFVNRSVVTPHGAKMVIEQVSWRRRKEWPGTANLGLTIWVQPPAGVPDLEASISPDDFTDDAGRKLAPIKGAGRSWGSMPSSGGQLLYEVSSSVNWPLPGNTFNTGLDVTERAPSLRQKQWLRHFHFDIPTDTIAFDSRALPQRPVGAVDAGDVSIAVQSVVDSTDAERVLARIRLTDNLGSRRAPWQWNVREALMLSNETKKLSNQNASADRLFWDVDGTPLPSNEMAYTLQGPWVGSKVQHPRVVSLKMKVRAERDSEAALDGQALPVPAYGKVSRLNLEKDLPTGSTLRLSSLGYAAADAEWDRQGKRRPPRLVFAVTYDYQPAEGVDPSADISLMATDNLGHDLRITNGTTRSNNRLCLRPPWGGATAISFRVVVKESVTGPEKVILFKNLPVVREATRILRRPHVNSAHVQTG
jgi:beta-lactamase regulating signal transducer with metallopeptidase domain